MALVTCSGLDLKWGRGRKPRARAAAALRRALLVPECFLLPERQGLHLVLGWQQ